MSELINFEKMKMNKEAELFEKELLKSNDVFTNYYNKAFDVHYDLLKEWFPSIGKAKELDETSTEKIFKTEEIFRQFVEEWMNELGMNAAALDEITFEKYDKTGFLIHDIARLFKNHSINE